MSSSSHSLFQQDLFQPLEYAVTRSRRRTLSINVREGRVEVRAPQHAPAHWIESFIREKTPWIRKQLRQQQEKLAERLVVAHGREVPFLGDHYQVDVILAQRGGAELRDDSLLLYTRDNSPEALEKQFYRWVHEQAQDYLPRRTREYAERLGVAARLGEVRLRKTKTKWGHCTHNGTIQYNWLAMMAPQAVVDYLVAHETSHLLHMDHSPRFWETVGLLCPEYARLRHWLRDYGHRFWTATG